MSKTDLLYKYVLDRRVVIDEQDWDRVIAYAQRRPRLHWYVVRWRNRNRLYVRCGPMMLHRFIMDCLTEFVVHHRDNNGLNNSRANLEVCTKKENTQKIRDIPTNNKSGKAGVLFRRNKNWRAHITVEGKWIHLGTFRTFEAAKARRMQAEFFYFGGYTHV